MTDKREGMHLKKDNIITPEARSFLRSIKREGKIDDHTFDIWKSELQKDLPDFWESMSENRRK